MPCDSGCLYWSGSQSRYRLVPACPASFYFRERFTRTTGRTSPVVSESCETLFQIGIKEKSTKKNPLLQKHIKWSFNPPYGSHFGGFWERCIRTIRKILQALPREQITEDESLVTFMCEVESIMNSRPITPNDMEPLKPNHVLLLKSEVTLPPSLFMKKDSFLRRRWKQVQYYADIFWRR